jgi:hypothetical protein
MMKWVKGLVSLCIFAVLFGGAWYLNEAFSRDHYIRFPETLDHEPEDVELSRINPYFVEDDDGILLIPPFEPREYMRIIQRTDR